MLNALLITIFYMLIVLIICRLFEKHKVGIIICALVILFLVWSVLSFIGGLLF